jgi:hypothetical protein
MLKRVIVILFLSLCALNFEFLSEDFISTECSDELCMKKRHFTVIVSMKMNVPTFFSDIINHLI